MIVESPAMLSLSDGASSSGQNHNSILENLCKHARLDSTKDEGIHK